MELEKNYLEARSNIEKDTLKLVNKYMSQTGLSYNEAIKKLTGQEMKEWRYSLESYMNQIERASKYNPEKAKALQLELDTLAMRSRITRLDMLKSSINAEIWIKTLKDEGVITKGFTDVFNMGYKGIQSDFKTSGIRTNGKLAKNFVEDLMKHPWSGVNFSDNLWGNKKDKLVELLNKHITIGSIQGLNVNKITESIRKDLDSDFKNTQRIVRTELNYSLGQSSLEAYKNDGIKQYEMLSCSDNRRCELCESLDGKKFNIEEAKPGINYHPLHPNCRCTSIPVVDTSWINDITPENNPDGNPNFFEEREQEIRKENSIEKDTSKKVENIIKEELSKAVEKELKNEMKSVKLTYIEEQSVYRYIGSESYTLNESLRLGEELTQDQEELSKNLDKALDKLPKYTGEVTRSLSFGKHRKEELEDFVRQHKLNEIVKYPQYLSSTIGDTYNPDGEVQVRIISKNGKNITNMNEVEKEILFKRGSKFEVIDTKSLNGVCYIYMKEIEDE